MSIVNKSNLRTRFNQAVTSYSAKAIYGGLAATFALALSGAAYSAPVVQNFSQPEKLAVVEQEQIFQPDNIHPPVSELNFSLPPSLGNITKILSALAAEKDENLTISMDKLIAKTQNGENSTPLNLVEQLAHERFRLARYALAAETMEVRDRSFDELIEAEHQIIKFAQAHRAFGELYQDTQRMVPLKEYFRQGLDSNGRWVQALQDKIFERGIDNIHPTYDGAIKYALFLREEMFLRSDMLDILAEIDYKRPVRLVTKLESTHNLKLPLPAENVQVFDAREPKPRQHSFSEKKQVFDAREPKPRQHSFSEKKQVFDAREPKPRQHSFSEKKQVFDVRDPIRQKISWPRHKTYYETRLIVKTGEKGKKYLQGKKIGRQVVIDGRE